MNLKVMIPINNKVIAILILIILFLLLLQALGIIDLPTASISSFPSESFSGGGGLG